jgi:hypothetical protein
MIRWIPGGSCTAQIAGQRTGDIGEQGWHGQTPRKTCLILDIGSLLLPKYLSYFYEEIFAMLWHLRKELIGKCGKIPKKIDLFLHRNNCYSDW